ncbi:MAG: hypothetical protein JWL59_151 [Chthoniobacteraceae bacterium]|nr:hypothetical protein [Chthoniobacteraceae bacterium]
MSWRYLKKNELDHELLWLCVSLAGLLMAAIWFRLKLQTPVCTFHELTGWPCPSCGCTRCLRHLLAARWMAALQINPLATAVAVFFLGFDLYAAVVTLGRLPRLRWDAITPRAANRLRIVAVTVIALNWAWLIHEGV